MKEPSPKTIDEYISAFPKAIQIRLEELRTYLHQEAPGSTENISHRIPNFSLNGNLVSFDAYPSHIGFYPGSKAIQVFKQEINAFKHSKIAVQFPMNQALPLELIKKIIDYKIEKNKSNPNL